MAGRARGTHSDNFVPAELLEKLRPLANQKKPACDFELERYQKTKRTQAPDRQGLVEYAPLLSPILDLCPRGQPKGILLKIVMAKLNDDFDVMTTLSKNTYKGNHSAWCDNAVEKISVACRHVRELAMSRTEYVAPALKALMDKIDIGGTVAPVPAAMPLRVVPHRKLCKLIHVSFLNKCKTRTNSKAP